ncbi:MAG: hypothetical protein COB04_10510 [Gammaproteobacteria bacterium]|nr:MAG: hypothetical protein COB04_10510 [Gammaproteobacteria bacterium]
MSTLIKFITERHVLKTISHLIFYLSLALSSFSYAGQNALDIHGFLTVGGTLSDSETPYLVSGEINDHIRFANDTILGLQFDRTLNDKIRIAAQFTANNKNNNFETNAQWLFAAFNVSPQSTVRTGRIRIPIFLQSATISVGNSFPWVRPPSEVYDMAEGITSIVGVDLLHRFELFDRVFTFNPYIGEVSENIVLAGQEVDASTEGLWGFSFRHESNNSTVRLGYLKTDATFNTSFFSLEGVPTDFISIGANYEFGAFEVLTEWAKRSIKDQFLGAQSGWYGTLVHHRNHFSPYFTLAALDSKKAVQPSLQDSYSYSLGLNTLVADLYVFKTELTYSKAKHGTRGLFQSQPPDDDNELFILSIAITGTF